MWGTTIGDLKANTGSLDPKPYSIGIIKGDTDSLDYGSFGVTGFLAALGLQGF